MTANEYLIRNREIQRRSRARRKDYIEDLENRVRQYQRDGIQATAEIQAAARKVAEENYWLRSLLAKHDVPTAEIQEHLESSRLASRGLGRDTAEMSAGGVQPYHHVNGPRWQPRAQVTQSPLRSPVYTTTQGRSDPGLLSPTSMNRFLDAESLLYAPVEPYPDEEALSILTRDQTIDRDSSLARAQASTMPCQSCERGPAITGADETSCEDAARIIAGMRGHEDPRTVWPELGCSTTNRTMVKNVAIFQMAD